MARIFFALFFSHLFIFRLSRGHTHIYSSGESSGPSIGEEGRQETSRFLAPPQNEIFFTSLNDEDSDPHVSDMFLMSKPPPSVPLGTVCL